MIRRRVCAFKDKDTHKAQRHCGVTEDFRKVGKNSTRVKLLGLRKVKCTLLKVKGKQSIILSRISYFSKGS